MRNYNKQKLNPLDWIKSWNCNINHISFNPNLKESDADFYKTSGSAHDGTMIFTRQNIEKLLIDLANKQSSSVKNPPDSKKNWIDIKYEVGFIKLATVFGKVDLPIGRYPGQRERCRISVKCHYVYD